MTAWRSPPPVLPGRFRRINVRAVFDDLVAALGTPAGGDRLNTIANGVFELCDARAVVRLAQRARQEGRLDPHAALAVMEEAVTAMVCTLKEGDAECVDIRDRLERIYEEYEGPPAWAPEGRLVYPSKRPFPPEFDTLNLAEARCLNRLYADCYRRMGEKEIAATYRAGPDLEAQIQRGWRLICGDEATIE